MILLSSEVHSKVKLLVLALLLASLELFIPRIPVAPWLKPGLANVITILWIYRYGLRDTILFGFLRVWILSLFFGFSFFTVSLGLTGMSFSVFGMWLAIQLVKKGFLGLLSVGVVGALLHNLGQLALIKPLMGEVFTVRSQLVIMFPASLVFGILTSYISYRLIKRDWPKDCPCFVRDKKCEVAPVRRVNVLFSSLLFGAAILLFYQKSILIVGLFGVAVLLLACIVENSFYKAIKPVKRAWLFLLCIFLTFLPFSSLDRILLALTQVSKVGGWLLMTSLFRVVQFDRILFSLLQRVFKGFAPTLDAALLVVEIFPAVIDSSKLLKQFLLKKRGEAFLTTMTGKVDELIREELEVSGPDK